MLLCRISCELTSSVHQPIVGSGQTNLSHLYFSRLSLAMPAKLNFFKTPTSVRLVQVGPCPLPLEYQAATSHTGRHPCRVKSLYMKRFWIRRWLKLSKFNALFIWEVHFQWFVATSYISGTVWLNIHLSCWERRGSISLFASPATTCHYKC